MKNNSMEKTLVSIRNIEMKDTDILMELNNSEFISNFVVGNPKIVTREEQLKWMKNLDSEQNKKRWIVEYDNIPVGTIILTNIDYKNKTAEINIKLLEKYNGKGIAKVSLRKICSISFNILGLDCLKANILSYNIRSQRLFESLGFKKDYILKERIIKKGQKFDLYCYSLLKSNL